MTLTRRRVLAALVAAGGAGALTGTGSSALFRSTARGRGDLTAGLLDLDVGYWVLASGQPIAPDPDGVVNGPRIDLPVAISDADASGAVLLRLSLPDLAERNNPAWVWLGATCPPAGTLAESLHVTVAYADSEGHPVETIAAGSLREVADTLRLGVPLDADPTDADRDCLTDELYLRVSYSLSGYVGSDTTALPLFVAGRQCRNSDPVTSPFGGPLDGPCEAGTDCECCQAIGKVNVASPLLPGETYAFDEGLAGYALAVTGTDGHSGVAFDLVSTDGGTVPTLCSVHVKGGPGDARYHSGDTYGTHTDTLAGTTDGLVYAPANPNSARRYDISYVLVAVCASPDSDGECPPDVVQPAASVDSGGSPAPSDSSTETGAQPTPTDETGAQPTSGEATGERP